jgi:hypothetical protein
MNTQQKPQFAKGQRVCFAPNGSLGTIDKAGVHTSLVRWDDPMADHQWIDNDLMNMDA